jgi:hypothetical protein
MANLLIKPAYCFIVVAIYIIVSLERLDVYQIKALYTVAWLWAFILFTAFFCIEALLLCLGSFYPMLVSPNTTVNLKSARGAGDPLSGWNHRKQV